MSRIFGAFFSVLLTVSIPAAELQLDFTQARLGDVPAGFRSVVSGEGKPGTWKIVEDKIAGLPDSVKADATVVVRHQALAQLDRELKDEHFPLLIFEGETFTDFTLKTRFKTMEGTLEQMAGIAFRIRDEKNYYVVRASSIGNSFRFYKFVDGVRTAPVGPQIDIPRGVWQELSVECTGNRIRCFLNGNQVIPDINDSTFTEGKIGFWTKSDSVSYFGDTTISYTPREMLAEELVRNAMKTHSRLLGLQVFARTSDRDELHLVASNDSKELGRPAGAVENDVVARGIVYAGKEKKKISVTMPLCDRNGEPIAAVRVILESLPGQTEDNAAARARPIVKEMESRVRSAKDLTR